MPITNDVELKNAVEQAGFLLQEIQDYAGRDFSKEAKVRFPRGYLRTATELRHKLAFLPKSHFKSNLSYMMMLSDVQHWLLTRTDISVTAKEMVIKLQIFLAGTVAESVSKVHLHGKCGGSYKKRIQYLCDKGTIDNDLKDELDWLWDMRNRMHIFDVTEHEWNTTAYSLRNHNRAMKAMRGLLDALNAAGLRK